MANPDDIIDRTDRRGQRLAVWGSTAALMVIPILPQRLLGSADGDPSDFIFLITLLFAVGAAFELAARMTDRRAYGTALGIAIAATLIQGWINLAVGVIGSEDNPANLIYAGVIAVAACGAVVARFRASEMALAMIAAAIAQLLALVLALVAGLGFTGPITVFFCALWLIAAWLFRRAARLASIDSGLNS